MTVTTEILMAYIDGQLATEEARRVEAEIALRPDLQAYVKQQQVLSRAMHDSFDGIINAPLPDVLAQTVSQRIARRRRPLDAIREVFRVMTPGRLALWSGAPAAAALACGILAGMLITGHVGGDIVPVNGVLVAHGVLAEALTDQLAARPEQVAQAKIGISFRNKDGHYCRTFQTTAASSMAGIACSDHGNWRIAAVAKTTAEPGGASVYQPAASTMPEFVRNAVMTMISGTPLDADGERKAKASGWTAR